MSHVKLKFWWCLNTTFCRRRMNKPLFIFCSAITVDNFFDNPVIFKNTEKKVSHRRNWKLIQPVNKIGMFLIHSCNTYHLLRKLYFRFFWDITQQSDEKFLYILVEVIVIVSVLRYILRLVYYSSVIFFMVPSGNKSNIITVTITAKCFFSPVQNLNL